MAKRKMESSQFPALLTELRRGIDLGSLFTDHVTALYQEAVNDRICGSWIAREGNRNLLIRKQGEGYTLLLCDTSRCYK